MNDQVLSAIESACTEAARAMGSDLTSMSCYVTNWRFEALPAEHFTEQPREFAFAA